MKYFSMFSGIGGFELGIQRAFETQKKRVWQKSPQAVRVGSTSGSYERHEGLGGRGTELREYSLDAGDRQPYCVGYSEIDKYADATYKSHFGGHRNYGDATTINARELPDFDLLVGGFPCQAFSVAGKRGGFDDTRGTLFFDVARICAEKRPRHLVLENVKGLLSHDNGKTFQTIIGVLTDLGYFVEWQVLNSKDFGVPQNRERVFIVGHFGGEPRRKVFPIINTNRATTKGYEPQDTKSEVAQTIRTRYGNGSGSHIKSVAIRTRAYKGQEAQLEERSDDVSNTINTVQKDFMVKNEDRIRRLTPIECERLQGFPDNWTVGSDTQRYKQCGNAVTVNVVEAVIGGLFDTI